MRRYGKDWKAIKIGSQVASFRQIKEKNQMKKMQEKCIAN